MNHGQKVVTSIFIAAVIIGVVSGLIIYHLYLGFFGGNPGLAELSFIAPFLATGIASAAFTIMLLLYPVIKKGEKSSSYAAEGGEDFK